MWPERRQIFQIPGKLFASSESLTESSASKSSTWRRFIEPFETIERATAKGVAMPLLTRRLAALDARTTTTLDECRSNSAPKKVALGR